MKNKLFKNKEIHIKTKKFNKWIDHFKIHNLNNKEVNIKTYVNLINHLIEILIKISYKMNKYKQII